MPSRMGQKGPSKETRWWGILTLYQEGWPLSAKERTELQREVRTKGVSAEENWSWGREFGREKIAFFLLVSHRNEGKSRGNQNERGGGKKKL